MAPRGLKYPAPTRTDHEAFCLTEGWSLRRRATNKRGTHHVNYELALPDGRILFTRISHPVDRTGYGPNIWSHILRDRLEVTPEQFWACVQEGITPDRGPQGTPTGESIPIEVVTILVQRMGVSEAEIRSMTRSQAIKRMVEGFSEPHR